MAANHHDRGAFEDLESMLERGLKLQASPPRWKSTYMDSIPPTASPGAYSAPRSPNPPQSAHYNPYLAQPPPVPRHSPAYARPPPQETLPSRSAVPPTTPPRVPVTTNLPQATYQRPVGGDPSNYTSPTRMHTSSSQSSITPGLSNDGHYSESRQREAQAEVQRQQRILHMQQQEQLRIGIQRQERLEMLAEQERAQERELAQLRERQNPMNSDNKGLPVRDLHGHSRELSREPSRGHARAPSRELKPSRDPADIQRERLEIQRREGAATMVQKTQDADGNVTMHVVKKGVEDFNFENELGAGSYSTVVAAQDKQTLQKYAIKILDKAHIIKEKKVKYVEIEKNTLNRLGDHPGIIRLYFTFQDRQSLYFVLAFAPNGELLHLIKRIGSLNEECARYYACQLLDAIEYMHERGVIHRDLKPENILLDYKMRIKITDFGTAKLMTLDETTNTYPADCRADSFVGTAEYVTPELLVDKAQGKGSDIWAWGCVLYQMIASSPPFQGNTQYLTFQKIAKLKYSMPPGFPYIVRELLSHVLVKAPQRWGVEEIKAHPFFENQDWSRSAIWGAPAPRLQPYKATVASMKPRSIGGRAPTRPVKLPVARPANGNSTSASSSSSASAAPIRSGPPPTFVPTAAGLQAVNPSTLYGMPVNLHKTSSGDALSAGSAKPMAPKAPTKPVPRRAHSQSASAATSALYKTPQTTSTAYQQSQDRINVLKRRMQEQRQQGKPASSAVTISPRSSNAALSDTNTHRRSASSHLSDSSSASSLPALNTQISVRTPPMPSSPLSPSSPREPLLPLLPITQLEAQWSQILISAQERILQMGHMRVYASTHAPPAVPRPTSSDGSTSPVDDEVVLQLEDDSLLSKVFHSRDKSKLVIVTSLGRLLVMQDDRKIQFDVPIGVPQVDVREQVFKRGTGRVTRIVIQTHNRALTLDDPGKIKSWMSSIELSRRYYAQTTAEQERRTFNAAAAAASAVSSRRRPV